MCVVESPRDCSDQSGLNGAYISGTNLIELCGGNVQRADQDLARVLSEEMVHAIQENFDLEESLIPEPLLTWLIRWTMDDREVMTVLLYDRKETDQEFEARLLDNLPNWALGSLLWISEHRQRVFMTASSFPSPGMCFLWRRFCGGGCTPWPVVELAGQGRDQSSVTSRWVGASGLIAAAPSPI